MPDRSRSLRQAVQPDNIPPWTVFVDTETVDVGDGWQRLLIGCYEVWQVNKRGIPKIPGNHKHGPMTPFQRGVFTTEDELYILLRSLGQSRCIAHNWQFDASVIRLGAQSTRRRFGYAIDMEQGTSFPIDKGYAPFTVRITWGGESYTHFLDNTNFHKTSLANLGESFNMPKLPMPELNPNLLNLIPYLKPYRLMLSRMDATAMGQWSGQGPLQALLDVVKYCKRDVEVLRESWFYLFRFSHETAGVTPGITVASMAKRCYQRRWLKKFTKEDGEQFIGSLDMPAVAEAEEAAFHGGRSEAFWKGRVEHEGMLRKYDVNSMYPFCMLERVPVQHLGQSHPAELINALNVYGGSDGAKLFLAKVTVDIPRDGMGWLGWEGVKLKGRGLCFPCGRFTTWAWQPMLDIAHKHGWIKKVHVVLAYRARAIFRDYVTDIYAMRKEAKAAGDAPRTLLLKYLLNSLYGKFGQRCFGQWVKVTDQEELDWQQQFREEEGLLDMARWQEYPLSIAFSEELADYLEVEGGIYRYERAEEGMAANSIASVAGFITAKARSVLWWAMAALKQEGHNIFMCDTDALITDGVMPAHMVGSDLGQWELEQESPASECEFMAPKHYAFGGKAVVKGVRNPKMGETRYRQAQFSRHQTVLMSKRKAVAETLERGARVKMIDKEVAGHNLKRQTIDDNMANDPLQLEESSP